jgi:hypothetical protein
MSMSSQPIPGIGMIPAPAGLAISVAVPASLLFIQFVPE